MFCAPWLCRASCWRVDGSASDDGFRSVTFNEPWRSICDASNCFHEFAIGLIAYYAFLTGDPDEGDGVSGHFCTAVWKFWAATSLVGVEDLRIGAFPAGNGDSGKWASLTDIWRNWSAKSLEGPWIGALEIPASCN